MNQKQVSVKTYSQNSKIIQRFPVRNTKVTSRIPEILRLCQGKKILHLGCTDMPYTLQRGDNLLHKKLLEVTKPELLWGLDVSQEGIDLLKTMGFNNLICGNGEDLHEELRKERFEIILAGEIIEHVANPGIFLENIASLMTENTELLLTTVNASSFKQFIHAMMRREKVHEDHNYYFSYRTIKQLLEKFDLKCKEIYYYQEIQGQGVSKALDRVASTITWISPLWADGLIVRATL